MLKKITISAILLVFVLFPISPIKAQTFTMEQNVVIEGLKAQLIQILLQQIAVLQEQIKQLIAQQNLALQQSETSGAVEELSKPDGIHVDIGKLSCFNEEKNHSIIAHYNLPVLIEGDHMGGYYQVKTNQQNLVKGGELMENQANASFSFTTDESLVVYTLTLFDKTPMVTQRGRVFNFNPIVEKSITFTLPSCQ